MRATEDHSGSHLYGLVTGSRNLKVDPVLTLQRHFAIVQPSRCVHQAKGADQFVFRQACKTVGSGSLLSAGFRGHPSSPHNQCTSPSALVVLYGRKAGGEDQLTA